MNRSTDKPERETAATGQRGVQSIHRAVALLRAVVKHNPSGVVLRDLAEHLGLHVATTRRMLKALTAEGLISRDAVTRRYYPGIELHYLGAAAHQFAVRDRLRPTLERIAAQSGDTVYLGLPSGTDILVIDRVEGAFPIRALTQEIGSRLPLGIGSGSLALLAFRPDKEVERIIRANKRRYSNYNNRSAEWVRAQIPLVRERGYTISEGNVIPGAAAVGVPILNSAGVAVAAIGLTAIAQRLSQGRREEIARLLKSEIAALGWLPEASHPDQPA